jgi:hypothetical protein
MVDMLTALLAVTAAALSLWDAMARRQTGTGSESQHASGGGEGTTKRTSEDERS